MLYIDKIGFDLCMQLKSNINIKNQVIIFNNANVENCERQITSDYEN